MCQWASLDLLRWPGWLRHWFCWSPHSRLAHQQPSVHSTKPPAHLRDCGFAPCWTSTWTFRNSESSCHPLFAQLAPVFIHSGLALCSWTFSPQQLQALESLLTAHGVPQSPRQQALSFSPFGSCEWALQAHWPNGGSEIWSSCSKQQEQEEVGQETSRFQSQRWSFYADLDSWFISEHRRWLCWADRLWANWSGGL